MAQLQDDLAKFATKGIAKQHADYAAANDFVKEKSAKTFERIAHYWDQLLA